MGAIIPNTMRTDRRRIRWHGGGGALVIALLVSAGMTLTVLGALSLYDAYTVWSAGTMPKRMSRSTKLEPAMTERAVVTLESLVRPSPEQMSDVARLHMEVAGALGLELPEALAELVTAEILLRSALVQGPASALAWTRLTYILLARGAPATQAISAFETSLLFAPNDRTLAQARITIAPAIWHSLTPRYRAHVMRAVQLVWGDDSARRMLREIWRDRVGQLIIRRAFEDSPRNLARVIDYFG